MKIQVIKRDGAQEPFDSSKIEKILIAAGLEPEYISTVIINIQDWASRLKDQSITSLQIRDQLVKELEVVDPYIAGLYKWYEKTKETV